MKTPFAIGADRSPDFQAGHRLALRRAVAWLHDEAANMNDPKARDILNTAAFGLGVAAAQARQTSPKDNPSG